MEEHIRKDHEFGCNQCDEEFRLYDQLVDHMKMNHEVEFECMEWREKFEFEDKLGEHVRNIHGNINHGCKCDQGRKYVIV